VENHTPRLVEWRASSSTGTDGMTLKFTTDIILIDINFLGGTGLVSVSKIVFFLITKNFTFEIMLYCVSKAHFAVRPCKWIKRTRQTEYLLWRVPYLVIPFAR
jgi:hypothetical protein